MGDIAEVTNPTSASTKQQVAVSLSSLLQIDASLIQVNSIAAGSVKLRFTIKSGGGKVDPLAVLSKLKALVESGKIASIGPLPGPSSFTKISAAEAVALPTPTKESNPQPLLPAASTTTPASTTPTSVTPPSTTTRATTTSTSTPAMNPNQNSTNPDATSSAANKDVKDAASSATSNDPKTMGSEGATLSDGPPILVDTCIEEYAPCRVLLAESDTAPWKFREFTAMGPTGETQACCRGMKCVDRDIAAISYYKDSDLTTEKPGSIFYCTQ